MDVFEKELKKITKISMLEIDENMIEFFINLNFFIENEVCLNFDDYNINRESDKDQILFLSDYIIDEISSLKEKIFNSIVRYAKQEYNKDVSINDFLQSNISITTIMFTPLWKKNTFCIELYSYFEEEHGIGIVIKDGEVKKIGYADICFNSIL